ncbi:MAG: class I SAM-dependent methyltransferase [Elusimicrobia bacterium]|nr:class I SAM-dependent methyltransferase [Elusimicrobiota bacterium]
MELCRRRKDCRLCASKDLELVFSLTPTPPANAFVPASRKDVSQPSFPLDLFFCRNCSHLQLLDVVDPSYLFENYVYVSGTSPVFVNHFKNYAADLIKRYGLRSGDFALDIGSNDGTLLGFFKEAGLRVLGVDPAKDIAATAARKGIETRAAFFTPELARQIRESHGPARVVTANNVFAHADDLKAILAGVKELMTPDGIFAFEVSYLADVYTKTLFDTIYHEHVAYHAVRPLRSFLKTNGLELIEALRVESHGGSLRGISQLAGEPRRPGASVAELVALETDIGLDKPETYRRFARDISARKTELLSLLTRLKTEGKKVAGFGAPAKATTLMHHFGLGPEFIDFIVDDSLLKQGLFSPGYHIPILPSSAIAERKPDYLLILAWNFAESIMAKQKAFHEGGGHFIVPLPKVEVK